MHYFLEFNIILKYSNFVLYGILVLSKIKYPIASGGLCPPQTPCFSEGLALPPIYGPDSDPPSENPGSAPDIIYT